ncbi:hypothetical protein HMPREF0580_1049 [Mobiluncus mulieris ATCC 35239]|uniref:Uncharacterized protein n=1 Tax=Mobiluncus mulieris ATCC 35239 TaxID=871571 RepID=E0QQ84_9ACTO|nr:hypothetical protein HMPREF0577_0374 [Mobiluncus mulieris ATCC 35243]EFM46279.1 hypothetical protein HMPREF0580_1049 [Mobiluncus mulieris ATCC 35239]
MLAFFSRGESLDCGHFAWIAGWHLMKRENTWPGESGREKPLHQLELP